MPEFIDWIQKLADKQILFRGYELECPTCGSNLWYDIQAIKEHMICLGCRTEFQIPVILEFAYRLNTLFTERYNEGSATVLLTLLLLYSSSQHDMIWQADVPLGENLPELDIIAMCDGRLIVSECKNIILPAYDENKLTEQEIQQRTQAKIESIIAQLRRDIETALSLKAHLFLFSTLDENIPDAIEEFIYSQDKAHPRMLIRLVTRKELLDGRFINKDEPDRQTFIANVIGDIVFPQRVTSNDCFDKDKDCKGWQLYF